MSGPEQNTTGISQGNTAGTGQQDLLDKAVDFGTKEAGHDFSCQNDEKISDGIRAGYKSSTGDDFPVADKQ